MCCITDWLNLLNFNLKKQQFCTCSQTTMFYKNKTLVTTSVPSIVLKNTFSQFFYSFPLWCTILPTVSQYIGAASVVGCRFTNTRCCAGAKAHDCNVFVIPLQPSLGLKSTPWDPTIKDALYRFQTILWSVVLQRGPRVQSIKDNTR